MQNQETCEGKNRLSTGTFSFNNLENDADYRLQTTVPKVNEIAKTQH